MKRHIPAPARGRAQRMTYCGVPDESPSTPLATHRAVVLAAHGGMLAGYCRRCLAQALASAFRQMEYGTEGALKVQASRSYEQKRDIGRRAARARWERHQEATGASATSDIDNALATH